MNNHELVLCSQGENHEGRRWLVQALPGAFVFVLHVFPVMTASNAPATIFIVSVANERGFVPWLKDTLKSYMLMMRTNKA